MRLAFIGKLPSITRSDYNMIVILIVFRLTQENGQRPSAIIGLTLERFAKREPKPDGKVDIVIFEHKTGDSEAAIIHASEALIAMLQTFAEYIRVLVPGSERLQEPYHSLILRWTTKKGRDVTRPLVKSTDSNTISRWLQHLSPGTATELRKASTIAIRQEQPEAAAAAASFMCHSQQTSNRYYNIGNRVREASKVSGLIAATMGSGIDHDAMWAVDGVSSCKRRCSTTSMNHPKPPRYPM